MSSDADAVSKRNCKTVYASFYGEYAERQNESYFRGTFLTISRLDAWMAAVVRCLPEKKTFEGY